MVRYGELRCVMLLQYATELRWCVTVRTLQHLTMRYGSLRHVAACCVAECYDMLRHVTVRYRAIL